MNDELFKVDVSMDRLQLARKRVADAEDAIAEATQRGGFRAPQNLLNELLDAERELARIEREAIESLRGHSAHAGNGSECPGAQQARSTERAS